jgi:hypothetical protein
MREEAEIKMNGAKLTDTESMATVRVAIDALANVLGEGLASKDDGNEQHKKQLAAKVGTAAHDYAMLPTSKDRENALLDAVSKLIGKKLQIVPEPKPT